jgi:hypothetical protein
VGGQNDHSANAFRGKGAVRQGSVTAASLYLQSLTMGFGTLESSASPSAGITVVQNYLVPRPEYPKLEAAKAASPPLQHLDIPTVVVR